MRICDDSDDLVRLGGIPLLAKTEATADCRPPGEETPSEERIHDCHSWRTGGFGPPGAGLDRHVRKYRGVIGIAEVPPAQDRNTRRFKVSRRYRIAVHHTPVFRLPAIALNLHALFPPAVAERADDGHTRSAHTGQSLGLLTQALKEGPCLLGLIAGLGHVRVDKQNVPTIQSQVERAQLTNVRANSPAPANSRTDIAT